MGGESAATRPLFVHIGLQKTGTSYLQTIFWHNREELAGQGLDLVPESKRKTYFLMLNVRERYQPEFDPPEVAGALAALPEQLRAAPGPRALITEESLAACREHQIAALMAACAEREVHVIITLRDLGRLIPSAWQQEIQSAGDVSFARYLRQLEKTRGRPRPKFWVNKDVAAVLRRWAPYVPAERTHIVTVPPSGADPEELLRRYCSILGIDSARLDLNVGGRNTSMGRAQTEVLALVNARLRPEDRRRTIYGDVGKRFLAVKTLVPQQGARIQVPLRHREWVLAESQGYVEAIRAGGYPVVGDLADLIPADAAFCEGSGVPTKQELTDAAVAALAAVVGERADGLRKARAAVPPSGLSRMLRRLRPGRG